jgi:hypothetical protein
MPEVKSYFGMYRGLVVDNKDPEQFGRVLVWIPDLMPEVSQDQGIWARPANNPVGGRNTDGNSGHYYMGTSYIPKIGSWMLLFFEGGNPNRPYYFAALDLENTKVLPENQLGGEYQHKWTIFKSHDGRTIVISDDPNDARTEITGKKRQLTNSPSGDTDSVYAIDGNQTTILFDERSGKEKILIRTYQGDFFNIDIENRKLHAQFESDIQIKSNGSIYITAEKEMHLKSGEVLNIYSKGPINTFALDSLVMTGSQSIEEQSGGDFNMQASGVINELAGGTVQIQGISTNIQSGANPSEAAEEASSASPVGNRD